jgi:hypothetical protein
MIEPRIPTARPELKPWLNAFGEKPARRMPHHRNRSPSQPEFPKRGLGRLLENRESRPQASDSFGQP